ncbi:CRAL-TRIO domain-containing protein [Roridomyces roridus]|uniref:CRAL-TRIO domain-containing protein n=1 Tax=Roridomyces roridus TaxID=1738132 RepID=A0AAD7CE37_9AGAR|nr:CRAL-TRIO domain-containing protein [Roridomyces roridus]
MDLLLKANREKLLNTYAENLEAVLDLQRTLLADVLPSVTDELNLDADSEQWAAEWLNDTCSLFQIMRRNKFTRSFAMESIRKTLVWRFNHLWPPHPPLRMSIVPPPATDPFGRPILLVEVVSLNDSSDAYKPLIIRGLETLRLHLKRLNENSAQQPILQYVILLDLKHFSTQSLNIDLVTWTLREVIPQFPGLLAAAFITNFNWAHSATWSIAKRVLPATALSRVFFPTRQELLAYFTPSMLPKDYGGTLPSMTELQQLQQQQRTSSSSSSRVDDRPEPSAQHSNHGSWPTSSSPSSSRSAPRNVTTMIGVRTAAGPPARALPIRQALPPPGAPIPATSLLNPFFGYPLSSFDGTQPPTLRHGRRRKRDLAHTLLVLAWRRWKRRIVGTLWLVIVFLLTVRGRRVWFSRASGSLWTAATTLLLL